MNEGLRKGYIWYWYVGYTPIEQLGLASQAKLDEFKN